jgi:pimeloyl-ACP methyl ester carboxylesterase
MSMPHLLVIVPGILGSVLAQDGVEVWAPNGGAFFRGILSLGKSITRLQLVRDSIDQDDIGDGVSATALIPDAHFVPGLLKVDGYSGIRSAIAANFEIIPADPNTGKAGNYLEFPYDWRRDNRYSANRLRATIDMALAQLRDLVGSNECKVILLTHSMGGLVSRYYLECLGGWRDCLALFSFGTPYRGSPNALNYLANGYKAMGLELTGVLRSCTSVYQLLPIYECILHDRRWWRAAELGGLPNIDPKLAIDALAFHREIESAVERNLTDSAYAASRYRTFPFVGVRQQTLQSAELRDGLLIPKDFSPTHIPALLDGGDGTVPRVSATPIELGNAFLETFHVELHASLQKNPRILEDVIARLQQIVAVESMANIRGPEVSAQRPGLTMHTPDAILLGEPLSVDFKYTTPLSSSIDIIVSLTNRRTGETRLARPYPTDDGWRLVEKNLSDGLYELTAEANDGASLAVHDIFEVLPADLATESEKGSIRGRRNEM